LTFTEQQSNQGSHAITSIDQHSACGECGPSANTAAAGPQEECGGWQNGGTVFEENNPDTMVPFYKDGVLWAPPTVRSDPGAVKAYFVGAFQALPKATVKFETS
jgi:hypothetical protein